MYNIKDEYERIVEHLHDCSRKAKSFKTTKRRLSPETLELVRQRGAAQAADNHELTFEKWRGTEKVIQDFYSDLFDSHLRLAPHYLDSWTHEHFIPNVFPSKVRHAIMSVKNLTLPGPKRIKSEHLKNAPPVLINTGEAPVMEVLDN
ncbi:hypothetical protein RB195_006926 [Necator americanus]|uniref:Uncharacterized protein n=1 Tax=Necator americanus TaxID=51031 RepID=A0ABR1BUV4_NECAM